MSERWTVHHADVLDALRDIPSESMDACFSDVPYGLGSRQPTPQELADYILGTASLDMGGDFMSKEWEIPSVAVWKEILRVLKPGAPVLSFAGSRTCDLISIGMRAAGFELRDTVIHWAYATGFPKSLDISKAIDKANGDDRPVVGTKLGRPGMAKDGSNQRSGFDGAYGGEASGPMSCAISGPGSPLSTPWAGYGTALKPAYEPCVLAMKPPDGTFAENALTYGVGGIAIDAARVGWSGPEDAAAAAAAAAAGFAESRARGTTRQSQSIGKESRDGVNRYDPHQLAGRWPANLTLGHLEECARTGTRRVRGSTHAGGGGGGGGIFAAGDGVPVSAGHAGPDGYERHEAWACAPGCPVAELDRQSGDRPGMSGGGIHKPGADGGMFGAIDSAHTARNDNGGASRFFFCAKASRFERDFGSEELPERSAAETVEREEGSAAMDSPRTGAGRTSGARNHHPCVKPLTLTQYLAGLILPPARAADRRKILIPYAGSGSEMIGALRAGWDEVIGIEREAEYIPILEARIRRWLSIPLHLTVNEALSKAAPIDSRQLGFFGRGK